MQAFIKLNDIIRWTLSLRRPEQRGEIYGKKILLAQTESGLVFGQAHQETAFHSGRISDERFMELSADYEAEQKKLKERAAELEKELAKTREGSLLRKSLSIKQPPRTGGCMAV